MVPEEPEETINITETGKHLIATCNIATLLGCHSITPSAIIKKLKSIAVRFFFSTFVGNSIS